jgi:hypothetical protein
MSINKSQGATIGAILLAGLFLRPVGSNSPQLAVSSNGMQGALAASKPAEPASHGPWIASCNYWAPARDKDADSDQSDELPGTRHIAEANETQYHVNLRAGDQVDVYQHPAEESPESACGNKSGERWGFPTVGPPVQAGKMAQVNPAVHVTTIIAMVPDPVHTHLALSFDRYVDALLQAAAENNYVSSYYWLPWKNQVGAPKNADSSADTESGHDPERERQPGLIVLKHIPQDMEQESYGSKSFFQVVYVFLVAESPTLGVDGFQLRQAFLYESEIESIFKPGQFSRGKGNDIAIIGPYYTGSAVSLRAGVEAAAKNLPIEPTPVFDISGATSTPLALHSLTSTDKPQIHYLSFQRNGPYEQKTFLDSLTSSGYDLNRVALLIEDDTAIGTDFAHRTANEAARKNKSNLLINPTPLVIRFPRDISMLRNAKGSGFGQSGESAESGSVPSPYLHFSLTDSSVADSLPQFSRGNTPLSQEAQLMAIARQLQRFRIQFVVVTASNTLDTIFLAQFLHRARPDARLVFYSADLLMEREIDNVPFVGAITITPYPLIGLGRNQASLRATRAYPESEPVAYFNAASYTFWDLHIEKDENALNQPYLLSYSSIFQPIADKDHPAPMYPSLWMTTNGTDGYYPLAILSSCASNVPQIDPVFNPGIGDGVFKTPFENEASAMKDLCPFIEKTKAEENVRLKLSSTTIYPSLLWMVLCVIVSLLCAVHAVLLGVADSRFSLTHDLAITGNDQPQRRSMSVHVGAAMLFSMAFFVACPALSLKCWADVGSYSIGLAAATLVLGLAAVFITFRRTRRYIGWVKAEGDPGQKLAWPRRVVQRMNDNIYFFINCLAWTALAGLPLLWGYLCNHALVGAEYSLVGVSFSIRCIHPASGVSPLVPALFLLFGWYLWAFFQTRRLRFSMDGRPHLPNRFPEFPDRSKNSFFVSDEDLEECEYPHHSCLFENITCLFITRNTIHRFLKMSQPVVDGVLLLIYTILLIYFSFFAPIRSLTHFLWNHQYLASPYEILIGVLFFPLMAIALSGWLRVVLIWSSLRTGLLQRLEDQPMRFAFDRLEGLGWMTMLRHDGLDRQVRQQARSIESARQILHQSEFAGSRLESATKKLKEIYARLPEATEEPTSSIEKPPASTTRGKRQYNLVHETERIFAEFAGALLSDVLIPYWQTKRTGLVESKEREEVPIKAHRSEANAGASNLPLQLHASAASSDPVYIQVAEEFLAIRYLSLIRAVLAHLGSLMSFVSASFVLAVMAWNSYPFQPREWVNWALTGLLLFLGSGIIWVFAQMHRDPILSRITETNANELGLDFYIRIVSFGAIPVLTWMAYQFPDIGNVIFRFIQPGLGVIK